MAANTSRAKQNAASIKLTKDPIPRDLEVRVLDKLRTARINLMFNKPFFGNLATRMQLTPADAWLHTAAVDGRRFYYNHSFIDMLDAGELLFLMGHEVLHLVYDHLGRREGREAMVVDDEGGVHSLHNIAADYMVNLELVKQGIGKMIQTVPCLYDTKYDGWASEAVYDHLYEVAKKNSQNQNISGMKGSPLHGMGDLAGQQFDEHLSPEDTDPNSGKDKNGNYNGQGPVGMTQDEQRQMRDELREAIINAARQAGAGNLPAGVERLIGELESPKMDWRTLLRSNLESTVLNDFSWMRPNRACQHLDAILPGMVVDQKLRICAVVDLSGSISQEQAKDFLSEVQGIMDQFPNYEILVLTHDTKVYNPEVFSSENQRDIRDYKLDGGGGTLFEPVYQYLREEEEEYSIQPPDRIVWFTDGYPNAGWGDPDYSHTVWILHGTETIVPPFGTHAYYKE